MCQYLLCAPVLYDGLERTLGDNNGEPVVTAAQAEEENVTNAMAKVGNKRTLNAYKTQPLADKKLKRVKCVTAPSAATDLVTYPRACAYGECGMCGHERRLPLTCPVDTAEDTILTVREFQMVKRGKRKQKEIVEVQMTSKQLLQKKKAMTVEFTKHQWDKTWDLHKAPVGFAARNVSSRYTSHTDRLFCYY